METFADRLRAEIEYTGLLQKEVAFKAGIKKRALDMYLGTQNSMPPADVAVKIANVLNVSVEYLVTGKETKRQPYIDKYISVNEDLKSLPRDVRECIINTIHMISKMNKPQTSNEENCEKP